MSGYRGGNLPPRDPDPVGEHRQHGRDQRGPGRDQGDLPAGHATGHDRMDDRRRGGLARIGWRHRRQRRRGGDER
jgi:hypothetical protein